MKNSMDFPRKQVPRENFLAANAARSRIDQGDCLPERRRHQTPLLAMSELYGDIRCVGFDAQDWGIINVLVGMCEKRTGEARFRLADLAAFLRMGCTRTLKRRIEKMDRLGFLTYLPGGAQGRGSMSRVILLHEAWGMKKERRYGRRTRRTKRAVACADGGILGEAWGCRRKVLAARR